MYLNKLTSTLALMNADKMQSFADFMHSEYFKVPQNAIDLFDYMHSCYPKFIEKKVNLETISKKVPSLNNGNKQAKAATEVMKALELFLAHEEFNINKDAIALNAIKGYRRINAYDLATKELERQQELLEKRGPVELNYFEHKHNLKAEMYEGFEVRLNSGDGAVSKDYISVIHTLDTLYAVKKLRHFIEVMSRKITFSIDSDTSDVPELLVVLNPLINENYPYIYLVAETCRMLLAAEDFDKMKYHYFKVKDYISKNIKETITYAELECGQIAAAQTVNWAKREEVEGGREYIFWSKWKIRYDLLLKDGKLLPVNYRNIVTAAAVSKMDPDWIRDFMLDYSKFLPGAEWQWLVDYGWAVFNYLKGDYSAAAIGLSAVVVHNDDVIAKCMVKRWQFINLYESNNDNITLPSLLLSFEKFVARNKEGLHTAYPVLVKILYYYRKLFDVKNIEASLAKLEKEEPFVNRQWIMDMMQNRINSMGKRKAR